ncbi:amidase [Sphingomonas sp. Xoc002]|uniref:amidase n=1 Tax=Sphingomonas sp. Xoc002 TaxID=2837624 RepID=UPI003D16D90F
MPDAILLETMALGSESGPRVAVKDCIDIAGYPTRCGSAALRDVPAAEHHAVVVRNLLAAGARIVGKANLHELAYGVTGINDAFGTPVNPRFPALVPGGSSSGSAAAVAAGLVDFAIGTDTGGSIRLPAACCHVFGVKPSFDRVSRVGCHPARSSLDCIGILARDLSRLMTGMRSIDPGFGECPVASGIRLGRPAGLADDRIEAALDHALQAVPAETASVELPGLDMAQAAGLTIIAAEQWAAFGTLANDARLGADVRTRLQAAAKVTTEDVAAAELVRHGFTLAVDALLESVDALVLPTLPVLPPALAELGDAAAILQLTALVRPFNLSGHPALSVPIALVDGRPVSLQLVGRRGQDEQLFAVARALFGAVA